MLSNAFLRFSCICLGMLSLVPAVYSNEIDEITSEIKCHMDHKPYPLGTAIDGKVCERINDSQIGEWVTPDSASIGDDSSSPADN